MPDPCPQCAARPYLCFEHNEEQRAREEDEETLRLFAARWQARLEREEAFAAKLARDAFFAGRMVAHGEMTLGTALDKLKRLGETLDDTLPIFAYMLPLVAREAIIREGFTKGFDVARGRHV